MSLLHRVPSNSRSPSKSSLRHTSGSQNPSARNLLPSPHFESDPVSALHDSPKAQDLELEDTIAEESGNYAIPPFQPFFTLIEDSVSNEHFHPTVHYIFADDDADIITEAACRCLAQNELSQTTSESQNQELAQYEVSTSTSLTSKLPAPSPGVQEHYLVLDVQPTNPAIQDGTASTADPSFEVAIAQSLSSEWQILRTSITNAPTMGDGAEDEEGLMLRIEGRGNTPSEAYAAALSKRKEMESLEEMVERFQKGLDEIRQVIDVSESDIGRETGATM